MSEPAYAPVADRRDARGRWLPGARPPGASLPVIVGETRQRIITALRAGTSVREAAAANGVHEDTIYLRMHDDEDLRAAIIASHQARRMRYGETIAETVLDRVVRAAENDADRAQDAMRRAIAIGTLLDAHAKATGMYQGGVNVAVQINVPRSTEGEWSLPADD